MADSILSTSTIPEKSNQASGETTNPSDSLLSSLSPKKRRTYENRKSISETPPVTNLDSSGSGSDHSQSTNTSPNQNTSRYGRARKPKITEDFYNTEDIFGPYNRIPSTPLKLPKKKSSKLELLPMKNKESVDLKDDTIDLNSVLSINIPYDNTEVSKVMKLVSSKSPVEFSPKSPSFISRPIKTYANRAKRLSEPVIESFALPDYPQINGANYKAAVETEKISSNDDLIVPVTTKQQIDDDENTVKNISTVSDDSGNSNDSIFDADSSSTLLRKKRILAINSSSLVEKTNKILKISIDKRQVKFSSSDINGDIDIQNNTSVDETTIVGVGKNLDSTKPKMTNTTTKTIHKNVLKNSNKFKQTNIESPSKISKKYLLNGKSNVKLKSGVKSKLSKGRAKQLKRRLRSSDAHEDGHQKKDLAPKTESIKKKFNKPEDKKENLGYVEYHEDPNSYKPEVGALAWSRVGVYPFWPSIVTNEPTTNRCYKIAVCGRKQTKFYHVNFFGDNGRRSWVLATHIFPFERRSDLEIMAQSVSKNSKPKDPKHLTAFIVNQHKSKKWETAVTEAENLTEFSPNIRLQKFIEMVNPKRKSSKKRKLSFSPKIDMVHKRAKLEKKLNSAKKIKKFLLHKSLSPKPSTSKTAQPIKDKDEDVLMKKVEVDEKQSELKKITKYRRSESLSTEADYKMNELNKKKLKAVEQDIKQIMNGSDESFSESESKDNKAIEITIKTDDKLVRDTPSPETVASQIARQKRNNLFRKMTRERACHICGKSKKVLRCKGTCCCYYHVECDRKLRHKVLAKLHNDTEIKSVSAMSEDSDTISLDDDNKRRNYSQCETFDLNTAESKELKENVDKISSNETPEIKNDIIHEDIVTVEKNKNDNTESFLKEVSLKLEEITEKVSATVEILSENFSLNELTKSPDEITSDSTKVKEEESSKEGTNDSSIVTNDSLLIIKEIEDLVSGNETFDKPRSYLKEVSLKLSEIVEKVSAAEETNDSSSQEDDNSLLIIKEIDNIISSSETREIKNQIVNEDNVTNEEIKNDNTKIFLEEVSVKLEETVQKVSDEGEILSKNSPSNELTKSPEEMTSDSTEGKEEESSSSLKEKEYVLLIFKDSAKEDTSESLSRVDSENILSNKETNTTSSKEVTRESTPKVELTTKGSDIADTDDEAPPNSGIETSASTLSLAEQIDLKMQEVMQGFIGETKYTYSTEDEGSETEDVAEVVTARKSPESRSKSDDSETKSDSLGSEKSITVGGKAIKRVIKHVTADGMFDVIEGEPEQSDDMFKCVYCSYGIQPPCFICKRNTAKSGDDKRHKCMTTQCGKFYHSECLKEWPQAKWKMLTIHKKVDNEILACSYHNCHTCISDDPRAPLSRYTNEKLAKCIRCPTTYHNSNYCIPAGTEILSCFQIICPKHLNSRGSDEGGKKQGKVKMMHHVNTSWCFICSTGGSLICCETCPSSFHVECLKLSSPEGKYICEECESGRLPLYDEIVWVKLGAYRWWPAQILFPNEIPENVRNIPHNRGEFVVKFFGSHDHYWVNRGRVFLFQEGDTGHASSKKTAVDGLFLKAIEEATKANKIFQEDRRNRAAEAKNVMKPPSYVRIKVNKPVGNVRQCDTDTSNTNPCDCDPNWDEPCGPNSDCLNRILLTECNPMVCPAGNRCCNQAFEKRLYLSIEPFKTAARGWGLKTLAPIKKGSFVIEYIGELIDEIEYRRRMTRKHEHKDENYYFLTIDKDRMIDAGPKGNVARFMNHSCSPNCETQKWTVNGHTRVGLFAITDISEGTELTFNYNLECIGEEKKECRCGASNCSGFIGVKVKSEETLKKKKSALSKNMMKKKKKALSRNMKKKALPSLESVKHENVSCFVCGETDAVQLCDREQCNKSYHLHCVNLEYPQEGKWFCPWHSCNICSKRTTRCCYMCTNSYCPLHSEGNIRYDRVKGFICTQHDPRFRRNKRGYLYVTKEDEPVNSIENIQETKADVKEKENIKQKNSVSKQSENLKKEITNTSEEKKNIEEKSVELDETNEFNKTSDPIKRGRGRPRKYPLAENTINFDISNKVKLKKNKENFDQNDHLYAKKVGDIESNKIKAESLRKNRLRNNEETSDEETNEKIDNVSVKDESVSESFLTEDDNSIPAEMINKDLKQKRIFKRKSKLSLRHVDEINDGGDSVKEEISDEDKPLSSIKKIKLDTEELKSMKKSLNTSNVAIKKKLFTTSTTKKEEKPIVDESEAQFKTPDPNISIKRPRGRPRKNLSLDLNLSKTDLKLFDIRSRNRLSAIYSDSSDCDSELDFAINRKSSKDNNSFKKEFNVEKSKSTLEKSDLDDSKSKHDTKELPPNLSSDILEKSIEKRKRGRFKKETTNENNSKKLQLNFPKIEDLLTSCNSTPLPKSLSTEKIGESKTKAKAKKLKLMSKFEDTEEPVPLKYAEKSTESININVSALEDINKSGNTIKSKTEVSKKLFNLSLRRSSESSSKDDSPVTKLNKKLKEQRPGVRKSLRTSKVGDNNSAESLSNESETNSSCDLSAAENISEKIHSKSPTPEDETRENKQTARKLRSQKSDERLTETLEEEVIETSCDSTIDLLEIKLEDSLKEDGQQSEQSNKEEDSSIVDSTEKSDNLQDEGSNVKRKRGRPRKDEKGLKGKAKKLLPEQQKTNLEAVTELYKMKLNSEAITKNPYENHTNVNEVKLTSNVPARHLRVVLRKNSEIDSKIDNKFLKMQNDIERDLPIRKRSKLRYEAQL